jgi:hypothetical protein
MIHQSLEKTSGETVKAGILQPYFVALLIIL